MNSADILRMATEERLPVFSRQKEILAFAALVEQRAAAIEREACAKLCLEKHANGNWKYDTRDECHDAIRARSKT